MKNIKKKIFSIFLIACCIFTCLTPTYAKTKTHIPRNGKYIDAHGYIYIMKNGKPRTGYFKYKGNWYYGHRIKGRYPKGSVTQGEIRRKDSHCWYAYGDDGKRINYDWYAKKGKKRILELDIRRKDHTVRAIYGVSRCTLGTRYNTKDMRMQYCDENGKWRFIEGMPFLPEYVDTQK